MGLMEYKEKEERTAFLNARMEEKAPEDTPRTLEARRKHLPGSESVNPWTVDFPDLQNKSTHLLLQSLNLWNSILLQHSDCTTTPLEIT